MNTLASLSDTQLDALSNQQVVTLKSAIQKPADGLAALAPTATLVAEGDSWFDFPIGTDLIDCLRAEHGYRIENFAKAGDTLENMIFGTRVDGDGIAIDPPINRVLNKLADWQPKVMLFSGGGNDVAGDEFASYLNHAESGLPLLREQVAQQMIGAFRSYLGRLLDKVAAHSPGTTVVMHGYGYAIPTGRGSGLFGISFVGPWMLPALLQKGVRDGAARRQVVRDLIDRYNDMLSGLQASSGGRLQHVDLRAEIKDADWRDELHLKNSAYRRCARLIHERVQTLL